MKTTARSILSTSLGFGLATFTVTSAFAAGTAASVTLIGFSALVMFGMVQIMMLSYAPVRAVARPRPSASTSPVRPQRKVVVPAVVEFSTPVCSRQAA